MNRATIINEEKILPFLKWAGGKRWLANSYTHLLPEKFGCYYEVFLGSGAIFFSLRPNKAVLSDTNKELIECYCAIRDEWEAVVGHLTIHHRKHSAQYYYQMRSSKPRTQSTRAARFIYLNRTCWNGLYRVNLEGKFNVPIGTKNNVFLDSDNFEDLSHLLQDTELIASDFESVIENAKSGDLIFADPPYTVRHNLNGFIKYNEKIFHWNDQVRLRDCLIRASDRGCLVFLTNANHPSITKLYKKHFDITSLERSSIIAARSSNRGKCEELVIKNF